MAEREKIDRFIKIDIASKQISDLNKFDLAPIQSPIISGISNFPSINCIQSSGSSGRYCGTGYIDDFISSLKCDFGTKLPTDPDGGGGDGDGDEGEEGGEPTQIFKVIENRFRWGYSADIT